MTIEIVRAHRADRGLLKFVDALAKRNSHAVGFLPMTAYETALDAERVLLLLENDAPAGYLIHGPEITHAKIYQVVIAEDARRIEHGRELIDHLRLHYNNHNVHSITLHCADDLDANAFWKAIGFQQIGQRLKDSTGRRWQNRYQQTLPAAQMHKLTQRKELKDRNLDALADLMLKGNLNLADVLVRPPSARQRNTPGKDAPCTSRTES